MAHVNERLGGRPCPLCAVRLTVRRNPQGTITANCTGSDGCDFSGFAKKGTKAALLLTQGLQDGDPAPEPSHPPAPAAPTKPPAKPMPADAFSMSRL